MQQSDYDYSGKLTQDLPVFNLTKEWMMTKVWLNSRFVYGVNFPDWFKSFILDKDRFNKKISLTIESARNFFTNYASAVGHETYANIFFFLSFIIFFIGLISKKSINSRKRNKK